MSFDQFLEFLIAIVLAVFAFAACVLFFSFTVEVGLYIAGGTFLVGVYNALR